MPATLQEDAQAFITQRGISVPNAKALRDIINMLAVNPQLRPSYSGGSTSPDYGAVSNQPRTVQRQPQSASSPLRVDRGNPTRNLPPRPPQRSIPAQTRTPQPPHPPQRPEIPLLPPAPTPPQPGSPTNNFEGSLGIGSDRAVAPNTFIAPYNPLDELFGIDSNASQDLPPPPNFDRTQDIPIQNPTPNYRVPANAPNATGIPPETVASPINTEITTHPVPRRNVSAGYNPPPVDTQPSTPVPPPSPSPSPISTEVSTHPISNVDTRGGATPSPLNTQPPFSVHPSSLSRTLSTSLRPQGPHLGEQNLEAIAARARQNPVAFIQAITRPAGAPFATEIFEYIQRTDPELMQKLLDITSP